MKKLAVLTAVLLLAVPIHSIAEETTVTETFNDQQINTDIDSRLALMIIEVMERVDYRREVARRKLVNDPGDSHDFMVCTEVLSKLEKIRADLKGE